jgi:uncharacterized protein (TIGR03437 family)
MRIPDTRLALGFVLGLGATCLFGAGIGPYRIDTVAGSSLVGDGGPAAMAPLRDAESICPDALGNLYVADAGDHRVRKISTGGIVNTVAGTGFPTVDALNLPYGVAVDGAGNVFIADLGNNRVRRVASTGEVSTVLAVPSPRNVLADGAGNLYISEFSGHRVVRLSPDGAVTTIAGTGTGGSKGDGGPAVLAGLNFPAGMAVDRAGNLYIADSGNHKIRKVWATGAITTVLGTGAAGSVTAAQLNTPTGVALDGAGTLYVADSGNQRIRKLTAGGVISSISIAARDVAVDAAGNVFAAAGTHVYKVLTDGAQAAIAGDGSYFVRGDGGPATAARLNAPSGVVLDAGGNLWIADQGNARVREVSAAGTISTAAGPAGLASPVGLALDGAGNLLIADAGGEAVRSLIGSSLVRVAGNGVAGYTGEGFPAAGSSLLYPSGVASAAGGVFYIADTANHRIRRVNAGGVLITVAGTGIRGWNGDGYGTATQIDSPTGLALDKAGTLYFADTGNSRIRKLTPDGIVTTVATGQLSSPRGVAVDDAGDVFVADTGNHRVLAVWVDGSIAVIAGTGLPGFGGDGDSGTPAQLSSPSGLALDGATGSLYIADSGNQRIRRLTPAAAGPTELLIQGLTVVNAATLLPGPVAACSLVSIFAANAGADGAQIFFDGQLAVLSAAQTNQANAQVPCGVTNQTSTAISLLYRGSPRMDATLSLANAAPGLFALGGGTGQAVAANEDGSVNSQANPAGTGSAVTLYATGVGVNNAVGVIVGSSPGTVLFAGDAPGLIGLTQINVQLPPDATGVQPVVLLAGNVPSQAGVTLAIE